MRIIATMTKHALAAAVGLMPALSALAAGAEPPGLRWADVARLPDFFTGNWQSASPMLDAAVAVPMTEQAKAYVANYKPVTDIPYAGTTCQTPGMPLVQRVGSPLKFFFQPGMIAVYIENDSMTRFIRLNAEHSPRPNPTYLGESVGHFEGDTLVVDTVGFVDQVVLQYGSAPGTADATGFDISKVVFGPHGPNLRMVERFRLLDADTLEDRLTIHDGTVWQQPYVSAPVQIFKRNRGEGGWPREWVCDSANVMPFDPAQNKVILRDPKDVLQELRDKQPANVTSPAAYKPTVEDWVGVNAAVDNYTLGMERHDTTVLDKAFWPEAMIVIEPEPGTKFQIPYRLAMEPADPPMGGSAPPPPVLPPASMPPHGKLPGGGPGGRNAIGTNVAPWHLPLNHHFEFQSATRATHYGYFVSVYPDRKTKISTVGLPGHYEDQLERRNGEWRIQQRLTVIGGR